MPGKGQDGQENQAILTKVMRLYGLERAITMSMGIGKGRYRELCSLKKYFLLRIYSS